MRYIPSVSITPTIIEKSSSNTSKKKFTSDKDRFDRKATRFKNQRKIRNIDKNNRDYMKW